MRIYHVIPWTTDKNIGKFYNDTMKLVNDDDWICFLDGDAVHTTYYFGKYIEEVIKKNPEYGFFICRTNKAWCTYQRYNGFDPDQNMYKHRKIGQEAWEKYNTQVKDVTNEKEDMAGFLMLISKKHWQQVGGFKEEGMLTIDNDIRIRFRNHGLKVGLMLGIYVQHWYRGFERLEDCMQNKSHLLQFSSPINLFTSYFISPDQSRQQEIDRCLSININNPNIKRIFLFLDCGVSIENVVKNFGHKKLNFIHLNRRPTYEDWIVWSKTLDQQISVFANSDIFFDHTIKKLELYLKKEKNIVCISRHNFQNNKWILHNHPEWSQDVWAIKHQDNINFSDQLSIKIGFTACDNRMACVFAINGWNIFNPCSEIKCFHFHRSEHRDYKKYDPNSAGFLALVPESNLDKPSEVTIIASPIKIENIKEVKLDNFLEKGLSNAT